MRLGWNGSEYKKYLSEFTLDDLKGLYPRAQGYLAGFLNGQSLRNLLER